MERCQRKSLIAVHPLHSDSDAFGSMTDGGLDNQKPHNKKNQQQTTTLLFLELWSKLMVYFLHRIKAALVDDITIHEGRHID